MCEECLKNNNWKFCPHCGAKLCQAAKQESKQPMTQEKFDEIFLDLLKKYNRVAWIDEQCGGSDVPTCRFELRDSNDMWGFDVSLDPKNSHFWFSYYRISTMFKNDYGMQEEEVRQLMRNQVSKRFKLSNVEPYGQFGLTLNERSFR